MALGTILGVNLVTPKGVVAHSEADSVQAPGELGEFELLPGHVPMLTALKPGVLTIGAGRIGQEAGAPGSVTRGARARYAVAAGYLRVDPTGAVEILVEQAVSAKDIDVDAAGKDLSAAEAEIAKWGDKPADGDYTNAVQRLAWAKARIDAVAH